MRAVPSAVAVAVPIAVAVPTPSPIPVPAQNDRKAHGAKLSGGCLASEQTERPQKTAAKTNSGASPSTNWPWINAVAGTQPCNSTAPGGFGSRVSKPVGGSRWQIVCCLLASPACEANRRTALLARWPQDQMSIQRKPTPPPRSSTVPRGHRAPSSTLTQTRKTTARTRARGRP